MPIYFNLSSQTLPLTVESIGNCWNQDSVLRPKGFPNYHWLQTEKGIGEAIIDGKRLRLTEGAGVLIAPFVPHAYHPDQSDWQTSFVTFTGKLENSINNIVGHERYIPIFNNIEFSFQDWINKTIALYETHQIDSLQLSLDCYAFLMNISSYREHKDFLLQPLYQRYVAPVIKEIETRYQHDITAKILADMVYVSPQYLSRLFKRFLGCSTYTYLTNYRVIKAKELLANRPDLAISQISYRVGYNDASHFIAMFRGTTGYTPLEFRQLHK